MSTGMLARIAIIEALRPDDGRPWLAIGDAVAVTLCYRDRDPEIITLTEYERRFARTPRPPERWYVLEEDG